MSQFAPSTAKNARARLVIDRDAVARNFQALQALTPRAETGAVVKADCYGLGAAALAPRLARQGCRSFFVATVEEGAALRAALNDAAPDIWVFNGYRSDDHQLYAANRLGAVINAPGECDALENADLPIALHIDTGMNRLGVSPAALDALADRLTPDLVMSHLACSEDADAAMNTAQNTRFSALAARFPTARKSLANTGGVLLGADYQYDLTRPGIGLYGATASLEASNPFEPVVRLQAPVLQVRDLAPGDTVGYGATYVADAPRRAATVAAGYADGLPRALSSAGCARIAGRPAPILGRVSMDLTVIDITGLEPDLRDGAPVEFFGADLYAAARLAGTLPYEILTGLGARAERIYEGQP